MNSDSAVDDIEEEPDEIYEELVHGNEIYDQVVYFPNDVKYQDFAVHWRIFFYTMINMLYFYQYFHFNIIVREYPVKIRSNAEGLRWCKFMNCSCNSFLKIIDQIIIDGEQERKSTAKDRRYIEKISNLLETISQSKISILTQVHTIPSLPVSQSINRSTNSQLVPEDLATQLYIFYQLTLFDGFKKEDFFSNKNTYMFEKIYNSLDDCNNFVNDYVKNQKNSQDVLNKWHKVQVFLMDFFNDGNDNSSVNGTNNDDFTNDLYSLVYDDYEANDEIEMYLNCNITLCQEAFELNQENAIRQFIILLLGTPFNIKLDINENEFQVDLRICWKRLIYSSKIMFNYHQYQYLNLLIIDSKKDNTLVSNIQCEKIKNYSNNINTIPAV